MRRVPGRRAQQLARPGLVRAQFRALVEKQGPAVESRRADGLLARLRIGVRFSVHGSAVFSAAQLASGHRQQNLRETATPQFGLHGFQPRHQRRAKNHGHHRAGAADRHEQRRV